MSESAPGSGRRRKQDASVLSDETCAFQSRGSFFVSCARRIKANVANRKHVRPLLCYAHWKAGERARRLTDGSQWGRRQPRKPHE